MCSKGIGRALSDTFLSERQLLCLPNKYACKLSLPWEVIRLPDECCKWQCCERKGSTSCLLHSIVQASLCIYNRQCYATQLGPTQATIHAPTGLLDLCILCGLVDKHLLAPLRLQRSPNLCWIQRTLASRPVRIVPSGFCFCVQVQFTPLDCNPIHTYLGKSYWL